MSQDLIIDVNFVEEAWRKMEKDENFGENLFFIISHIEGAIYENFTCGPWHTIFHVMACNIIVFSIYNQKSLYHSVLFFHATVRENKILIYNSRAIYHDTQLSWRGMLP